MKGWGCICIYGFFKWRTSLFTPHYALTHRHSASPLTICAYTPHTRIINLFQAASDEALRDCTVEVGAADGSVSGAEEWHRHCLALDSSDEAGYGEGVEGLETSVASAQVNSKQPIITPLN